MRRVLVTEVMDEAALDAFGPDFDVRYEPDIVDDRTATLARVRDVDAVIVRNRTQVNAELLEAAPSLRAVGRLGVGLDNIDLPACRARGVEVLPATGANAASVAEYVIGAALVLVRGAFRSTEDVRNGGWPRGQLGAGGEIGGRTLGLVGFGTIAREVARRAGALGMGIVAHDPNLATGDAAWSEGPTVDPVDLPALLSRSDVVSLHVPLTDATRGMLDAAALAAMRPGAVLINTARGGIVDEAALVRALRSGRLGGASLDVFATEPLDREAASRFDDVPNLILTPHIAGVTSEGNARVSGLTVANVMAALERGR